MYLREVMSNQEQLAFMVTLCHEEWISEEIAGVSESNFDGWLSFIGQLAVELSVPEQRSKEWPL